MITFTVPVTLVTRTLSGRDNDGNDRYITVNTTIAGVFAPGGSTESTDGGDTVITQPTVYLPLPAPTAVDEVLVNGATFEVDGDPSVWPANPYTGHQPDYPVVVRLRKVNG